jgi:hypothetical protein
MIQHQQCCKTTSVKAENIRICIKSCGKMGEWEVKGEELESNGRG